MKQGIPRGRRTLDWTTALLLCLTAGLAAQAQGSGAGGGAASGPATGIDAGLAQAMAKIRGYSLLLHINALASDEFEGRAPGSKGEDLTVQYLTTQFRLMKLAPGNPNGTFIQRVPMVDMTADPAMSLEIYSKGGGSSSGGEQSITAKYSQDMVAWTKRVVERAAIDGDIIFAGYGVQAPEFNWDDFKGADVKGKVIFVLINDPPAAAEEGKWPFGGPAMTYYGRWTYKFEKAAELGAAGCFIIHETGPAGYPWAVVANSWGRNQFDLASPDNNMGRVAVEGWVQWEFAEKIFRAAGKDLAQLKAAAAKRDFQPVPLSLRAKTEFRNTIRRLESRNVIAKLTGSDPKLRNEYVIYTAHWDHFGIGPEINGDKIYNGALDNASGTAGLLEIAAAYKALKPAPRRSILFLAVTGEEQGLLGSRYYAENPLVPLAYTTANVNMDVLNLRGRTRDIVSIGHGSSTIDEIAEAAVKLQGRVIKPDPEPEKGFFYRSDHFSFAKLGVPAFNPNAGVDFIGRPEGWGIEQRQMYTQRDYHKPSDEVKKDWVTDGAVEDLQLLFRIGLTVANAEKMPEWKPGTEFKAVREKSLRVARKM